MLNDVAADDEFDPLAYVIERADASEMKVEVWCCNYYEGSGTPAQPSLHPEWLVRSMSNQPFSQRFLSPSIPAVNSYLLSVITDLLQYAADCEFLLRRQL